MIPPQTEAHSGLAQRIATLTGMEAEKARLAVWAWERGEFCMMRGLATTATHGFDEVSALVDGLLKSRP